MIMVVAGAGVVMIPKWRRERINANESRAIAILKNISSAQSQVQASGAIDVDRNDVGEYGFFGELSGTVDLRGTGRRLTPPVFSGRGGLYAGRVITNGYVFQIFLPARDGSWVGEADGAERVDPVAAADKWLCYAWPEHPGATGRRWFLIAHGGDVVTSLPLADSPDEPTAGRSGLRCNTPDVAANTVDGEGRRWVIV